MQPVSDLDALLNLMRAIGDLTHATQRERGGSSVYLASTGNRFGEELTELQRETDAAIEAFLGECETGGVRGVLNSDEYGKASRLLVRLAPVRSSIYRLDITAGTAIEYFTDLDEALLVFCGSAIERLPSITHRSRTLGLLALMRAKELTGIERAILAQVFTEDRFAGGIHLWTVALVAAQETLLRIAVGGSDKVFAAELGRVNAATASSAASELETVALVNGVGDMGIDPKDWFQKITERIDLLKGLEDQTFENLQAQLTNTELDEDSDVIMAEAISAAVIGMRKLRDQVDQVRHGDLSFRDFMRRHEDTLVGAEQQLSTALQTEDLTARATRDDLTKLLNRSTVPSLISSSARRTSENYPFVATLMLDLDNFKVINDSLGHTVGDELLKAVAQRLRNSVRANDVVTRVGGDEFLIITEPVASVTVATELAEYVIAHCAEPYDIDGRQLAVNVSIGIGLMQNGQDADRLLRDADIALHRAKKTRSAAVVFDAELRQEMETRHKIETGLRAALAEGRIHANFQPIVDIATGEVVASEALARWDTGSEILPAGKFCPIAGEAGLLPKIDDVVIRSAFLNRPKTSSWQPAVTINVSDLQLRQPLFAEQLREDMVSCQISPEHVWVEITEHYALSSDNASDNLRRLQEMGCLIALDDFGSGYSALSVLQTLPLDIVKLDGLFVRGIDSDETTRETVRSVLGIIETLGLRTLAEGIETRQQLEVLADLGCEMAQGFYLSQPTKTADEWRIPEMPGFVRDIAA